MESTVRLKITSKSTLAQYRQAPIAHFFIAKQQSLPGRPRAAPHNGPKPHRRQPHRRLHGRHHFRLRHHRRRHGRCAAGQPPQRRPAPARAAHRGRPARRLPLDPHPGGLPVLHRQPAHRLALPDRTRRGPQWPQPALPARQDAGRLQQHQRHDLHARPGARLRPVGAAHRRRHLALGQRAAGVPPPRRPLAPGPARQRERRLQAPARQQKHRRQGRVAGREAAPALGRARRVCAGRAAGRHSGHRRLQRRQQRGRRLLRGQPEGRLALEHRQGLPAPALLRPAELRDVDLGPGQPAGVRNPGRRQPPLHRRAGVDRPGDGHRPCAVRGHPERRRHQFAAAAAALGHRPGGAAAAARHRRAAGRARRRRQPAGPPADPRGVQGAGRAHAQHPGQLAAAARPRSASSTRSSAAAR